MAPNSKYDPLEVCAKSLWMQLVIIVIIKGTVYKIYKETYIYLNQHVYSENNWSSFLFLLFY